MMAFWKWWTSIVLLGLFGTFMQYQYSLFDFVYENDVSRITFLIGFIFILTTLKIGIESWRQQFTYENHRNTDFLWFSSDVVMSIGMVGTLIGFLLVLTTTFTNVDTTSAAAMKAVIGTLASGMGIALMTTLAGLVSSIIIKFQLVMLESSDEKI
jgi:hypothetical protein